MSYPIGSYDHGHDDALEDGRGMLTFEQIPVDPRRSGVTGEIVRLANGDLVAEIWRSDLNEWTVAFFSHHSLYRFKSRQDAVDYVAESARE